MTCVAGWAWRKNRDATMAHWDGEFSPRPLDIAVRNLSFAFPDGSAGLQNITFYLPPNSRTLLIGGAFSP
jgi:ABC-type multidrug transport system fused ATPase/permease subunit